METDAQPTCRRRRRTPVSYTAGCTRARKGTSTNDICAWLETRVTPGLGLVRENKTREKKQESGINEDTRILEIATTARAQKTRKFSRNRNL